VTPEPVKLALPLGGGMVVVGPLGAVQLLRALRLVEQVADDRGGRMHPDGLALRAAFEVAIEQARAFVPETSKLSERPDAGSSVTTRSSRSVVLVDPISSAEAAALLDCSEQWVRACCRRGKFASAERRAGRWLIERHEVVAAPAG
jgi:hypothetical protein